MSLEDPELAEKTALALQAAEHVHVLLSTADMRGRIQRVMVCVSGVGMIGATEIALCIPPVFSLTALLAAIKHEFSEVMYVIWKREGSKRKLDSLNKLDPIIVHGGVRFQLQQLKLPLHGLEELELEGILQRYGIKIEFADHIPEDACSKHDDTEASEPIRQSSDHRHEEYVRLDPDGHMMEQSPGPRYEEYVRHDPDSHLIQQSPDQRCEEYVRHDPDSELMKQTVEERYDQYITDETP